MRMSISSIFPTLFRMNVMKYYYLDCEFLCKYIFHVSRVCTNDMRVHVIYFSPDINFIYIIIK